MKRADKLNVSVAALMAGLAPALALAQPSPNDPKVAPSALRSIPAETTAAA